MKRTAIALGAAAVFVLLAAANSGGYRFGVSDQAYYVPAVEHELNDTLFPRDAPLLEAQSRLVTSDELLAAVVDTSDASLPVAAAVMYVISLLVCLGAAVAFARGLQFSWWAVAALGLLLTLRHRIAKTGANSLEGYMHPRQLAFGLGMAALACVIRERWLGAVAFLAVAAALHPTTALWFIVLAGAGVAMQRREWRVPVAAFGAAAAVAGLWLVLAGPLAGRLVPMDARWLSVLAEKDYLFPAAWPVDAWLLNLAYPVVIVATWRARVRRGLAVPAEATLAWGVVALTLMFLVSVPLTEMDLALAVQLQITRVFWVMDFLAIAYIAWWLTRARMAAIATVALVAVAAAGRGYYLLEVAQPERQLVTVDLPQTAWVDAMRWLRGQPADWHVLADPGHAWKYGISVRVGAAKDTVLESVKDSAIALYDRGIAERVAERTGDLADFDRLTTARARALDAEYDLDAVVVEAGHTLDLPVLYRNARFVIYGLQ